MNKEEFLDKKNSKSQTSIYLRHWKPDEYILSDLIEIVIDGNTLDVLISTVRIFIQKIFCFIN